MKEDHKKFFDKNGYVVVKNLYSEDECKKWREQINKNFKLSKINLNKQDLAKKTFVDPDGVTKNSKFWPIIFNKTLLNVIENILEDKIKYTQHSDIHINLPAGKYHRDNAYRDFGVGPDWDEKKERYKVVRVAIYLCSYNESGSSLIILPGSHRKESKINRKEIIFWNYLRAYWKRILKNNLLPHYIFTRKKIKLKSNIGDCIIFDQRLLHAGGQLSGKESKYSIFLSYGVKNSHSINHRNFYLSRPTYTKKIPLGLKKKLKSSGLLL